MPEEVEIIQEIHFLDYKIESYINYFRCICETVKDLGGLGMCSKNVVYNLVDLNRDISQLRDTRNALQEYLHNEYGIIVGKEKLIDEGY